MASWPSWCSSARSKPKRPSRMRWSWRKPHETSALVRPPRERGATPSPPSLDGEPAGIARALDRCTRDERPHDGSGRLHRRFADVARAPFDADPRRGESRRGNPIRLVNAAVVAYDGAEAHTNPAPGANGHPEVVPDPAPALAP